MKILLTLAFAVLLALTTGCTRVQSTRPVGDTPKLLNPKDWNGRWISNWDTIRSMETEVLDAKQGIVKSTVVNEKQEVKIYTLHVRKLAGLDIVSVNMGEESGNEYVFARVVAINDSLCFFFPNIDKLKKLHELGLLPGKDVKKPKQTETVAWEINGISDTEAARISEYTANKLSENGLKALFVDEFPFVFVRAKP